MSAGPSSPGTGAPVVVAARGVSKSFSIPDQKVDSFKERATHPLRRIEHRTLRALHDVSFEVRKGEFFAIVGRNGSGKSTLLKILASIYGADAGQVLTAGRVAPFIELGVGFNPELAARENVLLNGVLMGLSRREAERRFDAVMDFAELAEFADLRVKNYSSGMLVRLAFAIMVQADADVMLIDEVLAVGDAAFSQKCMDVFRERRDAGKTVLLVTHDMNTVQSFCHRALLLERGRVIQIGEPEDAAMQYFRMNFDGLTPETEPVDVGVSVDLNVRVREAHLRDAAGQAKEQFEQDEPLRLDLVVETARELDRPIFVFNIVNEDGVVVFGFSRTLEELVPEGRRVRLAGGLENRLVPGTYHVDLWVRRDNENRDMALQAIRLKQFLVFGTAPRHGVVNLAADVEPVLE